MSQFPLQMVTTFLYPISSIALCLILVQAMMGQQFFHANLFYLRAKAQLYLPKILQCVKIPQALGLKGWHMEPK